MTILEIIEQLEKELLFVERWIGEKPEKMGDYLRGKQVTLENVIRELKEYENIGEKK